MTSIIRKMFFTLSILCLFTTVYADPLSTGYQDLLGEWVNSDPDTQGITRLIFETRDNETLVKTFGRCTPVECELEATALKFENGLPGNVSYEEPQFTMSLKPLLLANSVLQVQVTKQLLDSNATTRQYVITLIKK